MSDCRLVVVSCPARKPLQEIWKKCRAREWSDCELPITILSPEPDLGWNANLIRSLDNISEDFILLMLDDNYFEPSLDYTANIDTVLAFMRSHPDIALMKLQAGGAHGPEIPVSGWDRIREYDRRPHPFKRTNLVPAMYRRRWLCRLSQAVLESMLSSDLDSGRRGAIEFEVTGTRLTEDEIAWPERMMGIHRPGPDGGGGDALLACLANDAVTGGKLREFLHYLAVGVEGMEVYL